MSKLPLSPSIDRLAPRRGVRDLLQQLHGAPDARFLVLAGSRAAIVSSADRRLAAVRWFSAAELGALGIETADALFLGGDTKTYSGLFSVMVDDAAAETHADALGPLVDVRSLLTQGVLTQSDFGVLAEAKMLSAWHQTARFCGRCGSPTQGKDGGWKVACTHCAAEQFPRVDPCVIMLVTQGDNCVLAHEPRFPEKMYSTLAGFVEPGEDIRSAVRRETLEEVGVKIGDVDFFGSQPWPFQHSLMIGCMAQAVSEAITIDRHEIVDARWFGRSEVRDMLAMKHPRGLFVPGGHAIAHAMIRRWAEGT